MSRNQASKPMDEARGRGFSESPQISVPRRQMEHIASISRSSGLGKDGDTLKNFKVQEEYRGFLRGKVDNVLRRYPQRSTETDKETTARVNAQENVLILFRKLREGIYSSRRTDAFALEVYETSLYLATIFESPKQTTAVIPHLVPALYLKTPSPHNSRLDTVLISLLHHLVATYPSQGTFRQFFDTIPSDFLPRNSAFHIWITSIARSLRSRDYACFSALSSSENISKVFGDSDRLSRAIDSLSLSGEDREGLSRQALLTLAHCLRRKVQNTSWEIIRSAYRELSSDNEDTRAWLRRSLCLHSLVPYCYDISPEEWLEQHSALGHTRQKVGANDHGKWLIYKVR
ncbi:hypothetical protein E4T56_gene13356 [Termitomyces sp. T112]|nr:hypothetical protein E4T56_gene13356 [Termitomyces sp. T112]